MTRFCRTAGGLPALVLLGLAAAGAGTARAQVGLPTLEGPLTEPLDPALEPIVEPIVEPMKDRPGPRSGRRTDELGEKADELPPPATPQEAAEALEESGRNAGLAAGAAVRTAGGIAGPAGSAVAGAAAAARGFAGTPRPFVLAADPAGWPVEKDLLVVLVDDRRLAAIARERLAVVARHELPALGLSLLALKKPRGTALAESIDGLRRALPEAAVDYNHLYRLQAPAGANAAASGRDTTVSADAVRQAAGARPLKIGMIDSAVVPAHFALRGTPVVAADFVGHEGTRPSGHGTAVASLIVQSAGGGAGIWSASVFFAAPGYAPGASTESLVAALDWLAAEDVDVVNMSLAGPGNAVLERAVAAVAGSGPAIVAAVGNNGPSGEPLYPAAYDDVVGVTAVDRDERVFTYANRGAHVDFAALGVDVKVADSEGSWRVESGTSMASPQVAVAVARILEAGPLAPDEWLAALAAGAKDLGERGVDEVYGHGLIGEPPVLLSRQRTEGAGATRGDK